jgi:hypothetical protein
MLENKYFLFFKKYWWWFALASLLIIFQSSHIYSSDEGIVLNAAWEILHSKKLYVDFFDFISPGSFYLLAFWWKIFPVSYVSAKILFLSIVFFSSIGLWRICAYVGIKNWGWLPPFLYIVSAFFWDIINHNTLAVFFVIWSAVFFLYSIKKEKSLLFFITGLLMGLTAVALQHKGVVIISTNLLAAGLLLLYKKISLKNLAILVAGSLLPITMLFIFWSPLTLFENLIFFPLQNYPQTNVVPFTLILIVAFLSFVLFSITSLQNEKRVYILLYFIILQTLLLLSVLQRADPSHVSQIIFPLFILLAIFLEQLKMSFVFRVVVTFEICFALLIYIFTVVPITLFKKSNPVFFEIIQTYCPEDSFYSGPFLPGLYFEFRKTNKLPYSILITNQQTTAQFNNAANLLSINPPSCAVLNYDLVKKFNYTKDNPVDEFFQKNYRAVENLKDFGPGTGLYILK